MRPHHFIAGESVDGVVKVRSRLQHAGSLIDSNNRRITHP
jgi:hypothetical protein